MPWIKNLWIHIIVRTKTHCSLKQPEPMRADLDDFVTCDRTDNRNQREESDCFKCFAYDDLIKRDKVILDIFWLKDDALENSANLPAPEIIAAEIMADLQAALERFSKIAADLGSSVSTVSND